MLQIDETILSKILNGFREPSPELKLKLASLLQCDPVWLFEKQINPLHGEDADGNPPSPVISTGLDGTAK